MANFAQVTQTEKGIQIEINHPLLRLLNPQLVEACIQRTLECAEKNACVSQEHCTVSEKCLAELVDFNRETKCLETCFGFASR